MTRAGPFICRSVQAPQVSVSNSAKRGLMALHWKEILEHTTTWVTPEVIMLSAISQSRNSTYCMIPLT